MGEKVPAPGQANESAIPTIMVVTHDPKLLKLLDTGLRIELDCDILGFTHTKSAEETAKHITPDLLILDYQVLHHSMYKPHALWHGIQGLERVPTLLVNVAMASLYEIQDTSIIILTTLWSMEALYAAVHKLLGRTTSL